MAKKVQHSKQRFAWFRLKPHSDGMITVIILILMLFGSLMIVSTNVGRTVYNSNVVLNTTIRQMIIMGIGYFIYIFSAKYFSIRWASFLEKFAVLGLVGLLLLTFFFSESGGSHAWIRLGSFTLQPSEFTKVFIVLTVALSLYRAKRKKKLYKKGMGMFKFPWICMAVFGGLILAQKDMGTLAILTMTFLTCLLIPSETHLVRGQKWIMRFLFIGIVSAIGLFGVTDIGTQFLAKTSFTSHIATRIYNMKNPYENIYGEGYQSANSLYGIGSSNVVGKGIGDSSRKYGYLTQADNDYILAVIIEETGVFGFGLIVVMFLLLIGRLFYYAFKTNEVVFKVILVGVGTYFFMHFFLNVGGVACLIPFTGVPILFISSGGSSLFAACLSLGICQYCIRLIREREMGV